MKLKEGVITAGLKPELLIALQVCETVFNELNVEFVITSLNDSKHSETSLHYAGAAADIRIWDLDHPQIAVEKIKSALGGNPDYDVILEKDHIHIEYQPKFKSARN